MTYILEPMPSIPPGRVRWTREAVEALQQSDFLDSERRYEVIDGEIIALSDNPPRRFCVQMLFHFLNARFQRGVRLLSIRYTDLENRPGSQQSDSGCLGDKGDGCGLRRTLPWSGGSAAGRRGFRQHAGLRSEREGVSLCKGGHPRILVLIGER